MLKFGAVVAFMGVNAAALVHYWGRADRAQLRLPDLLIPLGGFSFCLYLWISLRWPAIIAGGAWLAAGVLYGAIKARGFRRQMVSFDLPPETCDFSQSIIARIFVLAWRILSLKPGGRPPNRAEFRTWRRIRPGHARCYAPL